VNFVQRTNSAARAYAAFLKAVIPECAQAETARSGSSARLTRNAVPGAAIIGQDRAVFPRTAPAIQAISVQRTNSAAASYARSPAANLQANVPPTINRSVLPARRTESVSRSAAITGRGQAASPRTEQVKRTISAPPISNAAAAIAR